MEELRFPEMMINSDVLEMAMNKDLLKQIEELQSAAEGAIEAVSAYYKRNFNDVVVSIQLDEDFKALADMMQDGNSYSAVQLYNKWQELGSDVVTAQLFEPDTGKALDKQNCLAVYDINAYIDSSDSLQEVIESILYSWIDENIEEVRQAAKDAARPDISMESAQFKQFYVYDDSMTADVVLNAEAFIELAKYSEIARRNGFSNDEEMFRYLTQEIISEDASLMECIEAAISQNKLSAFVSFESNGKAYLSAVNTSTGICYPIHLHETEQKQLRANFTEDMEKHAGRFEVKEKQAKKEAVVRE